MNIVSTAIAFVVALGLLIVFHELGHYLVARLCGVKVLRFSVGFGAPIWQRKLGRDGTEWAIGAFPLGGYVKMLDEREAAVAPSELHRAFNRQNVWRRSAIVAAGPIANFLLAIALYWVLFVHGMPGLRPVVDAPPAGSAAAAARFETGDIITRVGTARVDTWQDVRWQLLKHAIKRDSVTVEVEDDAGAKAQRTLDLGGLDADDLDADFLRAIGLGRYQPAIIGMVEPGSVADRAGLRAGDQIVGIDDAAVARWSDFVSVIREKPGVAVVLQVVRGAEDLDITVTPAAKDEAGKTIGRIGVGPIDGPSGLQRYTIRGGVAPLEAIGAAARETLDKSVFTLQMLWEMIFGRVSPKNLSGPLTIADYAGQSAQLGWIYYLQFLAVISISLGVLNLLPVPLLDGGHLMYYFAEILKGSPVSERTLEMGQRVGMIVLFGLMAFAIYNDINRLVGGS
ncbi:MAG: RIP metalloprotease RseP [Burkholderiales bacterium]|nr:RIP metalloprotease RseP [Burkholderiales bacterium]